MVLAIVCIYIELVIILGLSYSLAGARCHGWVDGWRNGYDEGWKDRDLGKRPNPTRKTC